MVFISFRANYFLSGISFISYDCISPINPIFNKPPLALSCVKYFGPNLNTSIISLSDMVAPLSNVCPVFSIPFSQTIIFSLNPCPPLIPLLTHDRWSDTGPAHTYNVFRPTTDYSFGFHPCNYALFCTHFHLHQTESPSTMPFTTLPSSTLLKHNHRLLRLYTLLQ